MQREPGFYWVRYYREWEVAEWDGRYFHLVNDIDVYNEKSFDEIGGRITPPEEK